MPNNSNGREHWGSRYGFILAAAGSAVGLGNIWKFPFITGMNGGAAFVIFYLLSILIIGLPVMLIEFSIGRKTQLNPVGAFKSLAPKGPFFLIGVMGVAAGFIILSYYSVVAGWTMWYIFKAAAGTFSSFTDPAVALEAVNTHVGAMLGMTSHTVAAISLPDSLSNWDALRTSLSSGGSVPDSLLSVIAGQEFENFAIKSNLPLLSHFVFMAICVLVVIKGIKGGIEKWNRILMPTLFIIILLLVFRGLTLEGSSKGLAFLFAPDFSKLNGKVMMTALGHAFFTLSLGMGAMLTYGSYLSKHENLISSALWVIALDTLVALLAGVAIFTSVFALGFEPAQGPGLVFYVLPGIFALMPGGLFVGVLFFLLLTIAAVTSGVSLLEVVTTYFIDSKGWSRRKATLIFAIVIFLLGVPSSLSMGMWSHIQIFGYNIFDFLDYLSFKYLLPLGGLFMVIFTIFKWGTPNLLAELRRGGSDLSISSGAATAILYVTGFFIAITFVMELFG